MPFYTYPQNNSGGNFVIDKKRGISVYVIIEADSTHEANAHAEQIGLYFDGYNDCSCCGQRWNEFWGDPDPEPMVYGKPVADAKLLCEWAPGRSIVVHYKDGRVKWPAYTVAK